MDLAAPEVRVLGCLVEKQRTVPDTYPMTLNGLVTACNQSSSRWPVVRYEPAEVQRALDSLKGAGLVRFVHPAHGERSTKYRHVLDEALGIDGAELAVLAVLALRGPQTAGELRTRTERLHAFTSVEEVEATLAALGGRADPLAELLPRRPGEREARWIHHLGESPEAEAHAEPTRPAPAPAAGAAEALEARVARLELLVGRLYELLGEPGPSPEEP